MVAKDKKEKKTIKEDVEIQINEVMIFGKKELKDYLYSWLRKSEVHNRIILSAAMNYIGKMDRVVKFMQNNGWDVVDRKDKTVTIKYIDNITKKEKTGKIEVTEIVVEKIPAARRF